MNWFIFNCNQQWTSFLQILVSPSQCRKWLMSCRKWLSTCYQAAFLHDLTPIANKLNPLPFLSKSLSASASIHPCLKLRNWNSVTQGWVLQVSRGLVYCCFEKQLQKTTFTSKKKVRQGEEGMQMALNQGVLGNLRGWDNRLKATCTRSRGSAGPEANPSAPSPVLTSRSLAVAAGRVPQQAGCPISHTWPPEGLPEPPRCKDNLPAPLLPPIHTNYRFKTSTHATIRRTASATIK